MTRREILSTLLPGFTGLELPEWVRALLAEGLGGVCLFGGNVSSPGQLRRLTDEIRLANPHALIAIDEEGGDVTRLYYDRGAPFPGNALLGLLDDVGETAAVARRVGLELRRAGVNLDFAPDADINSNPDNPVIGVRSFGAEPELVATHTAAWTAALQSEGVAACVKHFPGHGDTAQDSHLALPVVDRSFSDLERRELRPFAAAVEAGAATIMTSHILLPQIDPANPATFSPAILGGLLRDHLGFRGVIVSDALDMAGASGQTGIPRSAARALAAGCDLLCIGTDNSSAEIELIVAEVARARGASLPAERLTNASRRVEALAAELCAPRSEEVDTIAGMPEAECKPSAAELARLASAFQTTPEGAAALKAIIDPVFLRLDAEVNIAIGDAPWGPFAADPAAAAIAADSATRPDDIAARLPTDRSVVVIGRDNHRRAWVRTLIDHLRSQRTGLLVIDMGWPDASRRYADIATFGASRLVGRALLSALARHPAGSGTDA